MEISPATEIAIDIIKERKEKLYYGDFKLDGVFKWTDEELICRLKNQKLTPPLTVIENFMLLMDRFAQYAEKNHDIFELAYQESLEIIDEILSII